MTVNIYVIGAGASGTHIAQRLATQPDVRVYIIEKETARVNSLVTSTAGLAVSSKPDDAAIAKTTHISRPAKVYKPTSKTLVGLSDSEKADLVIVATKAYDLDAELAATITSISKNDTPVLELTNGLKVAAAAHEGKILSLPSLAPAKAFNHALKGKIVNGVINYPTSLKDNICDSGFSDDAIKNSQQGSIRLSMEGADSTVTVAMQRFASVLHKAGISTVDGRETVQKLAYNKLSSIICMGLQGIFDASNAEIADAAEKREAIGVVSEELLREFHQLGKALGVVPENNDFGAYSSSQYNIMHAKGGFKGSLLPDINKGKPTENAAIYGAIAELGEQLGLAMPVMKRTHDLLKVVEAQGKQNAEFQRNGLIELRAAIKGHLLDGIGNSPKERFCGESLKDVPLCKGERAMQDRSIS